MDNLQRDPSLDQLHSQPTLRVNRVPSQLIPQDNQAGSRLRNQLANRQHSRPIRQDNQLRSQLIPRDNQAQNRPILRDSQAPNRLTLRDNQAPAQQVKADPVDPEALVVLLNPLSSLPLSL